MREETIAERYALALYEIAAEADKLEQFNEELGRVAGLFESSSELQTLCAHPRFDQATRGRVLGELFERLALPLLLAGGTQEYDRFIGAQNLLESLFEPFDRKQPAPDLLLVE